MKFWKQVANSSTLKELAWTDDETLLVTFKNEKQYRYFGVPKWQWENLASNVRPGQYFASKIRNNYKCELVQPKGDPNAVDQ